MARRKIAPTILVILLVLIGIKAGTASIAIALAQRSPELALKLDPGQATALAAQAASGFSEGGGSRLAQEKSVSALLKDPMQPRAAAQLGIVRQLQGRPDQARGLLEYAHQLSLREFSTHLWWIEYWAERGNLERVLYHYDAGLSTSRAAPSVLFPVLVRAVANPLVASKLAKSLNQPREWHERFLLQTAQSGSAVAIETLFSALDNANAQVPIGTVSAGVQRLVDLDKPRSAVALYSNMTGKPGYGKLRSLPNSTQEEPGTLFDWALGPRVAGYFEDGRLVLSDGQRGRSLVAEQHVMLAPGRAHFRVFHNAGSAGEASIQPQIDCANKPIAIPHETTFHPEYLRLSATIPEICQLQVLRIYTIPSNRSKSANLSVQQVVLESTEK